MMKFMVLAVDDFCEDENIVQALRFALARLKNTSL
jgi:hypothetical protein